MWDFLIYFYSISGFPNTLPGNTDIAYENEFVKQLRLQNNFQKCRINGADWVDSRNKFRKYAAWSEKTAKYRIVNVLVKKILLQVKRCVG